MSKLYIKDAREKLTEPLQVVIEDLEQYRKHYFDERKRLEEAIESFNQYGESINDIYTHLSKHYQVDRDLGKLLPLDRQRVESSIRIIQEHLTRLDKELTYARTQHEASQRKKTYRL